MNIDKITEAELKQKVMKMMEDADDKVEGDLSGCSYDRGGEKQRTHQSAGGAERPRRHHDEEYRKRHEPSQSVRQGKNSSTRG